MTTTTLKPEGRLTDLVDEVSTSTLAFRRFRHEDGSYTVLTYEQYTGDYDPRHDGETYAHLVSESRDYNPLDDADEGIEAMRKAAEVLKDMRYLTDDWSFVHEETDEHEQFLVRIRTSTGYNVWLDLDDEYEARVVEAYFIHKNDEGAVRRYIDQARPEVLHYVHEWSVTGSSQGDWREGWAYVLAEDVQRAGFYCDGPRDAQDAAKKLYEGEMKEYAAYFAGEVYRATHVYVVGPEWEIGEHGGYYTGEILGATDTVGGFIAYDDLKDICAQFTDSPVVDEEWI